MFAIFVFAINALQNKIPFDESMYEVLRTSIQLLTDRVTDQKKKLSETEAQWFANAVEIILRDADMYGPPLKPVRTKDE